MSIHEIHDGLDAGRADGWSDDETVANLHSELDTLVEKADRYDSLIAIAVDPSQPTKALIECLDLFVVCAVPDPDKPKTRAEVEAFIKRWEVIASHGMEPGCPIPGWIARAKARLKKM